jgi:hypothetical protein
VMQRSTRSIDCIRRKKSSGPAAAAGCKATLSAAA